jgi:hypothetical protein
MAEGDSAVAGSALKGEVVYFYAFDIAYELRRPGLTHLLGQPLVAQHVGVSKRSPRQQLFYQPRMARLEPLDLSLEGGKVVKVERSVKVLPIGAISLTLKVSFEVDRLEQLSQFHRYQFAGGALQRHARELSETLRQELGTVAVRPVETLQEEEAYTVFCVESPGEAVGGRWFNAEEWFRANRRTIATLITQETSDPPLSHQEALESTSKHLSYYQSDLIVVDWDAALIVDRPADFEESLFVMELANVQLEELEAYDQLIDTALERSYADLQRPPRIREHKRLLPHLREVRIDLARFSDELSNITKFFGDWHLARLYDTVSRRFHLPDWHRSIDEKLKTLDDLYEMLKQEQNHRIMLVLEASIVLMFVIDIVLLLAELAK